MLENTCHPRFLVIATVHRRRIAGAGFILFGSAGPTMLKSSHLTSAASKHFDDSRMKFDVRYYLVAILFIIFDLEIAFLFPWAVSLDVIGGFGLLAMAVFLA
jgi:NADH-quinone oxidoreductase subunit A